MSLADQIRDFVRRNYIEPARSRSERMVLVQAGDIHKAMGLRSRVPAVCAALVSRRFREENGLELMGRSGPPQGSNTEFRFRLPDSPEPRTTPRVAVKNDRATGSGAHACSESEIRAARGIYLVSCVGTKRETDAPARDLYTSDWFVKARQYVEATGCPWFILSAKHGLVRPDRVLSPYEKTLRAMSPSERREWGAMVIKQMRKHLPRAESVVVLAGKRYREPIQDYLERRFQTVLVPLEGLRIGEQLRWLSEHSGAEDPAVAEFLEGSGRINSLPALAREHYEVARSFEGFFDRAQFVARYHDFYPNRNEGSIIPSDYCFNRENKGNRNHPRFLWWDGSKSYVFLGLDGAPLDFREPASGTDTQNAARSVADELAGTVEGLSLQIDRARELAVRLDDTFSPSGSGIFGVYAMPEDLRPTGVREGSREHLLYITLVVSVDYMRDADKLWDAAKAAYADPDTRFLFEPESVCTAGPERTGNALQTTSLAKMKRRDSRTWFVICETLHNKWRGDPRKFLDDCEWHAPTILRRLRSDHHSGRMGSGPDFPFLKGPKIGSVWIRMLRDNVGLELAGLEDVAIPVDVHILRATLCTGAITGRYLGSQMKIFPQVRRVWRESVRGLTRHDGKPMVPLDVDKALWVLSRKCCSERGSGHLGPCPPGCPARPGGVTGRIRITDGRCDIETHAPTER